MTSQPYAAAIFDLDGTLLDTERLAVDGGEIALAQQGISGERHFLLSLVGQSSDQGARLLKARFPALDLDRMHSDWSQADERLAEERGILLRPTALELLGALDRLPLALCTSSRRVSATRKLDQTGLARYFRAVVTADDVTHKKPDPEPYLTAARALGVDPADCVAFEDSDTGAASANAARMTVVQVPDMGRPTGRNAHHLAETLIEGALAAGLLV